MLNTEFLSPSNISDDPVITRGREVIRIEANGLEALAESLDENFVHACDVILNAQGRLIVTGMGKSGHVGKKAAATFSATGTPSFYVHPGEASHGDLGMLVPHDTLVVISNSGNTAELHAFLTHAKAIGVTIIGIAGRANSRVMRDADVKLLVPAMREACRANVAPTTSTTMQLALCDALAMAVMDIRGFSHDKLAELHPGGAIGLRLLRIREIMHSGPTMPLVGPDDAMVDVISTMTSGGFGIAGVIDDDGGLVGVVTDGDVRRNFGILNTALARDVMTTSAKTLDGEMNAESALELLNDLKVSAAFILEDASRGARRPIGVIHVHDFLRIGLN